MIHARNRRRLPLVMPATVHIRRSYTEARYGQLHVTTAYPSGGGFDERTPLLCIHPAGSSSRFFSPLLPELGRDRSLYVVDLPGHGSSDGPEGEIAIADLAAAIAEFLDSLRLRTVDVAGSELGALVALELALSKPQQVRRLVLSSVPYHNEHNKELARGLIAAADGAHVLKEWQRLQAACGASASAEQLTDELADALRARRYLSAIGYAMAEYPTAKRLATVRQPGLLLRTDDGYGEHTQRAKSAYAQAILEELPGCGSTVYSQGGQRAALLLRQFLDR